MNIKIIIYLFVILMTSTIPVFAESKIEECYFRDYSVKDHNNQVTQSIALFSTFYNSKYDVEIYFLTRDTKGFWHSGGSCNLSKGNNYICEMSMFGDTTNIDITFDGSSIFIDTHNLLAGMSKPGEEQNIRSYFLRGDHDQKFRLYKADMSKCDRAYEQMTP